MKKLSNWFTSKIARPVLALPPIDYTDEQVERWNEQQSRFAREVAQPIATFAFTFMFICIALDYTFQFIDAIDVICAN